MKTLLAPDEARDLAIRLTNALVLAGFVPDCTDTDDEYEFAVQDTLRSEIQRVFNLPDEDTN